MRLELNFSEVMEKLDYITSMIEDNLDDSMKNVIFQVTEKNVKLIGHNDFAICKYTLEESKVSNLQSEEYLFQINAKEFSGLLKTLGSMRRTRVESIYFENADRKMKLTIEEDAISEDLAFSEYLKRKSYWYFGVSSIRESIMKEIRESINAELEGVVSRDIRLYLDTLAPLMTNERNATSSKMYFGSDFVFVVPKLYATLFENNLREEFRNMALTCQEIKFLTKVLTGNELVDLGRTDRYLILCTENFEVYMKYQSTLPSIEKFLDSIAIKDDGIPRKYAKTEEVAMKLSFINRENGIVIDKIYVQDVLRRFVLTGDTVILTIKPDKQVLNIRNDKSDVDIPLIKMKGMQNYGDIQFRMKPDQFAETLLGGDDIFTTEMFMYFIKRERGGYTIANMDSTCTWFTILQI